MKMDPGSNYTIDESHAAKEYAAGAHNGATVDHANHDAVSFFISVGTVGSSATVDMKTQYSDDDSTWADYDDLDDDYGNDTNITQIDEAGDARLDIPNPYKRYSRVVVTVATAACSLGVTSIAGPKRHVAA